MSVEDWEKTGFRGHSAEALWGVAVSRGEATIQGRRLGAQSSDRLDSELLISLQLTVRGTTPDSPWVPTHYKCLLIIYWGQGCCPHIWCRRRFFLCPSLPPSFLSFKTYSWSINHVPGTRDPAVNTAGSACHQGAYSL